MEGGVTFTDNQINHCSYLHGHYRIAHLEVKTTQGCSGQAHQGKVILGAGRGSLLMQEV